MLSMKFNDEVANQLVGSREKISLSTVATPITDAYCTGYFTCYANLCG